MGKRRSTVATRFWTLKSMNFTSWPSFWMILANLRAAKCASCSFLAPVHTNFPDLKMSEVHRGSRILMTTPWNRCGLYSLFRVRKLICCKFSSVPRETLATQFWIFIELIASWGPEGAVVAWRVCGCCEGSWKCKLNYVFMLIWLLLYLQRTIEDLF